MKKYIIILLGIIGTHTVFAQSHAFQKEFAKHPDISHFRVEMRGDSVSFIGVNFKKDTLTTKEKKIRLEEYNFWFDGDRYLFSQKYNREMMDLSPSNVDPFEIINKPEKRKLLCALIYPDSIVYKYEYSTNWPLYAVYKGDGAFSRLGNQLQRYAPDIALEKDSILLFQTIIGLDGNIEEMELTQGKGGQYTDDIIRFFKSRKDSWRPMVKDGRLFRSLTDISVRLRNDGKVITSYSYSQRIPKIEIKDYTMMWPSYYP